MEIFREGKYVKRNRNERLKMIGIEKGNTELYRRLFGEYATRFTDGLAEKAAMFGRILIAYADGEAAGFLLTNAQNGPEFISYVFALPEMRGRGVMQALVSEAVKTAEDTIGTALADSHTFAPAVMHVLEKLGFERVGSKYMFSCDGDDIWDRWDAFMEKKGKRLCETLRRQGYSIVTLAEAPEELLGQYRETPYNEYANPLNHQHLLLPGAEVTKDVSVMCTLNGKLAAYVFAYMPDRASAIFKTLSSSAALQGGGAILLPIAESLEKVRGRGCRRLVFSMGGNGDHANAFRDKVLSVLISKRSERISYVFRRS